MPLRKYRPTYGFTSDVCEMCRAVRTGTDPDDLTCILESLDGVLQQNKYAMRVQRVRYVNVCVLRGHNCPPAMRKGQHRREARHGSQPKALLKTLHPFFPPGMSDASHPKRRFTRPATGDAVPVFGGIPASVLEDPLLNGAIDSLLPRHYNFEIHKTVHQIRQHQVTCVAVSYTHL